MALFRFNLSSMKNFLAIPKESQQSLTWFDVIRLKNWMLAGIFIANIVSLLLMEKLIFRGGPLPSAISMERVAPIGDMFRGCLTFIILASVMIYEKPIRRTFNDLFHRRDTPQDTIASARRRLLNEPFFMMALNLCVWILAAFFFSSIFNHFGESRPVVMRMFLVSINTGLITAVMSFFLIEHIFQAHVSRFFFPDGGLYNTPKTIRIRVAIRFFALLFACNIIPLLSLIQLSYLSKPGVMDAAAILRGIRAAVVTNSVFFILVGLGATQFVAANFVVPLREIIRALKDIRRGNFDRKVLVTSNDELGYTGDVINEMAAGLKERDQMRQSLFLAREVQQKLLPAKNPNIDGLDIAGSSIYCDETGGDYYDFIIGEVNGNSQIGVAIGDVSGHGISSALLMAAVRSSLRQRSSMPGSTADIIADVNRQLVKDVEDSGQFVTMFYLTINPIQKRLQYVRAGHAPALFYDPHTGQFKELGGDGMALGVDQNWQVTSYTVTDLQAGQILFLSTDGIWEARNRNGSMFGKEPIYDIIRKHASLSANEILNTLFDALSGFQKGTKIEDDITSVVIKFEKGGSHGKKF